MLYVGLCRSQTPGGDEVHVTDDVDCMPPSLLAFPGLQGINGDGVFTAAKAYIEEWDLLDKQSPPVAVTINTAYVLWEGLAIAKGESVVFVEREDADG